jgi:hypothetical protein
MRGDAGWRVWAAAAASYLQGLSVIPELSSAARRIALRIRD